VQCLQTKIILVKWDEGKEMEQTNKKTMMREKKNRRNQREDYQRKEKL
jgi:hypothetical protein